MMDFSDHSIAQRRSIRLQEVAKMEANAVGRSSNDMLVLDTTGSSPLRRSQTIDTATLSKERRPSDTEIRSLWRLRVMAVKMDESGHSCH